MFELVFCLYVVPAPGASFSKPVSLKIQTKLRSSLCIKLKISSEIYSEILSEPIVVLVSEVSKQTEVEISKCRFRLSKVLSRLRAAPMIRWLLYNLFEFSHDISKSTKNLDRPVSFNEQLPSWT